MKNIVLCLLVLCFILSLFSCGKTDTRTQPDSTKTSFDSVRSETAIATPSQDYTESYKTVEDLSESDETTEDTSYIGALSEDERKKLIEYVNEWYRENFSEYEVLSVEIAEDDNELAQQGYSYYPDMKPGEIIILLVHTTHGSKIKDGKIEGIPRTCFVKITESGFEVFNEGY